MLWWSEIDGVTGAAFTDRSGGVSAGPWAGLNLAHHVQDAPQDVERNRRALHEALGPTVREVVYVNQVHGNRVAEVDGPWSGPAPDADALVTTVPGLALAVMVADCVPVVLRAPGDGVVAVAHAGRPGMAAGVVGETVAAMRALGADAIDAVLGPSVCGRCYEVPVTMREEVAAVAPVARSVTWHGSPSLDVSAGVLAQLSELGVPARQLPGCTVEDRDLYSYRRDGVTGRFAGLAWLDDAR